jgi:uncharacterized protein YjdB
MKKILIYAMLLAVAIISMTTFVGCKKDPDFSTTPLAVTGANIDVRRASDTVMKADTIAIGEVRALIGHTVPMNATNQGVTWYSSETGIATINSQGVVTASETTTGTTFIILRTVENPNLNPDTLALTVVPVTGVALSRNALSMSFGASGDTAHLRATVEPSGIAINRVTWSTSNADVATVNSSGVVTARGVGSAVITARTVFGDFEATCAVTVSPAQVTGVSLNMSRHVFNSENVDPVPTDTILLRATVTPRHAVSGSGILWINSNPSVATLIAMGDSAFVISQDWGETTITVTTVLGGAVATCAIFVGVSSCEPEVTVANIATFVPDPDFDAVAAFLNGGAPSRYEITLMSTRLDGWRSTYAGITNWPVSNVFDRFTIVWPYSEDRSGSISNFSYALLVNYKTHPGGVPVTGVWPFVPNHMAGAVPTVNMPSSPILVPMTGSGNNPKTDATFYELFRRDRTTGGPHSTSPPTSETGNGYGFAQSSTEFAAISGIFATGGRSNSSSATYETSFNVAVPNTNLIGVINSPAGWTIIRDNCDPEKFWFRSKANSSDWFVVERRP